MARVFERLREPVNADDVSHVTMSEDPARFRRCIVPVLDEIRVP